MGSVLECLPQDCRVAILRLRSLGDCVLTTPAIDILKRFRPDLRLAVVVEDRFRAVFEGNPDLDRILRPEPAALRTWRPRLCLNLHGGSRSAWLTALSGARHRAGFAHFRRRFVYNLRIPRAQEILGMERVVHTAEHLASAMFHLGVPLGEIPRAKLFSEPGGDAPPRPLAILHPFAATPQKTWPRERFLAIAEHWKQSGLEPVFIGAAGDDLSPFSSYRTASGTLSETKRLLKAASLFVGNDSGPAHMAAAFGLPVVVIFGDSDPAIWGPWRTASAVVTSGGSIARVEVEQVIGALSRLRVPA
ncbi:MAG TPA: glycosyltransferase family 9 protein [Bryobacteraceae bacterium]|nr:glycosyltransferase family 9 protein [Bryobacteraceae bacterium]